jgi:hypothetical protein
VNELLQIIDIIGGGNDTKGEAEAEDEVIAAYGAAMVASFQVIIIASKKAMRSFRDSFRRRFASTWKW